MTDDANASGTRAVTDADLRYDAKKETEPECWAAPDIATFGWRVHINLPNFGSYGFVVTDFPDHSTELWQVEDGGSLRLMFKEVLHGKD